jgi:H/ACA ribonucleoprotein complex subunit 4
VGVFTQKCELVAIAEARVGSDALRPGTTGLVAAPRVVFMESATYPRGWKKKKKESTG